MPKVSVIIPTYNRKKLVNKAVKSAQNQSFEDIEILVCDDGSTDSTDKIISEISKSDKRVVWVPGNHKGLPAVPRNKGIDAAMSKWVAFLDDDDEWRSDKIEIQLQVAEETGADLICSNATRMSGDVKSLYFKTPIKNISFGNLLKDNFIINSSTLVKKNHLKIVGGISEDPMLRAVEDYFTWLKIASVGKVEYLHEELVVYRDDPGDSIRSSYVNVKKQKRTILAKYLNWAIKKDKKNYRQILIAAKECLYAL